MRRMNRRGGVLVLSAFFLVAMMALLAFSVDTGVVMVAQTELQRTADASALAAAWDLIDDNVLTQTSNAQTIESNARATAATFANYNGVLNSAPQLSNGNVKFGFIPDPTNSSSPFQSSYTFPNAVQVTVERSQGQNGRVPFFFARAMGHDAMSMQATATAAIISRIKGFQTPSDGGNLDVLPFALDVDTWNDMLAGNADDHYTWDDAQGVVLNQPDGIKEVNLYPQGTGSPGNRGTVDIGSSNNATTDIARQIQFGISPSDLNYHGGKLEFDSNGEISLNGDTGISAGVRDELAGIIGEPRIIPVFQSVLDNGDNANYTIVKLVGIRVLKVRLTGSMNRKHVIIQPAIVKMRGGIPSPTTSTSDFVYSPAWLVK